MVSKLVSTAMLHWYMLRVHRGAEHCVIRSLSNQGVEAFYLRRFIVRAGGTVRIVPLTGKSSGYVFARFAPSQAPRLRGIRGFVSFPPADQLIAVSDDEVDQIRKQEGRAAVAAFGRAIWRLSVVS